MEPLIKIEKLAVGYDKTPVLEDINFEIFERDFIGVIGPNGGGKTTLLKAILGLLKPTAGKIIFRKDIDGRKKPIGYLPQVRDIDRKFPITVYDVVRSGSLMRQKNADSTLLKQKINDLLNETRIYNIRNKAIGELSGGQMQRIALARAFLRNPDILILEGLNVLQRASSYPQGMPKLYLSDLFDFSIYVDAAEADLENWYLERFLQLRQTAFKDPEAYFHNYAAMPETDATTLARRIWAEINAVNLRDNIYPTRERAHLILGKGADHRVTRVQLRKI